MTTNDAFIKAYRRDRADDATPTPAGSVGARRSAVGRAAATETSASALGSGVGAALHTVEFATAGYVPATTTVATTFGLPPEKSPLQTREPSQSAPAKPIIGKRPLSSFQPQPRPESAPLAASAFTPETIISAFRWPSICRALWNDYAVQYERVAETLMAKSRAGRPLIGVCGISEGDGCSTTLLCLAVALAARNARIALVDANFQDPQLGFLLGTQPTIGWTDVLERGLSVSEAMIRATSDRIDLLPIREDAKLAGHEAADLVAGRQTSVTAGVLRTAYDIVLIDLGALLAPGAYAAMSHVIRLMPIDAAVVVANPQAADAADAAIVGELLEEDGCELLGVIENRAKPQAEA